MKTRARDATDEVADVQRVAVVVAGRAQPWPSSSIAIAPYRISCPRSSSTLATDRLCEP
jgi:hypothetical protein